MKVLVACEFSGIVRDAFLQRGHDAWSCDLLPTEKLGPHIQDDVFTIINQDWDIMLAFYPCTNLAVSGARWFTSKIKEQEQDVENVRRLLAAPIPKIAVENPIGILSSRIRKPDQIIQPWQFGHGETKATCLWLKGLPKLEPTNIVEGRKARVHGEPPGPERWKNRSRTYTGIAEANGRTVGLKILPILPAISQKDQQRFDPLSAPWCTACGTIKTTKF